MEKISEKPWLKLENSHFSLVTDYDEKSAKRIIEDLENFRYYIRYFEGLNYPEDIPPLRTYIFKSKSIFKKFVDSENVGGYFTQGQRGPFIVAHFFNEYGKKADHMKDYGVGVLQHEYVHYAMSIGGNRNVYPAWYREGLAEYLSTFEIDGNKILYGRPPANSLRAFSAYRHRISLEETIKGDWKFDTHMGKHYAVSTLFYHYMNADAERKKKLKHYLKLLASGKKVDEAWKAAIGASFKSVQNLLKAYVEKNRFPYLQHTLEQTATYAPPSILKLDKEGSLAELLKFELGAARWGRDAAIEEELRALLKANATRPESILLVAQSYVKSGKYDAAKLLVSKAKGLNTEAAKLLQLEGEILMRSSESALLSSQEIKNKLTEARKKIRQSIKIDRTNFVSFYLLGEIYSRLVLVDPDINLKEGLIGYSEMSYYFNWTSVEIAIGRLFLYQGDTERAKLYAEKVLRAIHISKSERASAEQLLSSGDTNALRQKMNQSFHYGFHHLGIDYASQILAKSSSNITDIHNSIAWFSTVSINRDLIDPEKALHHATKSNELSGGKNGDILDTLAAAYALNGDFESAVSYQKLAIKHTESAENKKKFKKKLKYYKRGEPYHAHKDA